MDRSPRHIRSLPRALHRDNHASGSAACMAVITSSQPPQTTKHEGNGATGRQSFPQAWHRSGRFINTLVQVSEGNHTSDVYSHDAVLVALTSERTGAAGHANSSN